MQAVVCNNMLKILLSVCTKWRGHIRGDDPRTWGHFKGEEAKACRIEVYTWNERKRAKYFKWYSNGSSVNRCLYGVFSDLLTYWPKTRLRPTQENFPEPLRDESAQLGFAYHALIMPHVLMGPRWITAVLGVYPHGSGGGVGFNRGVAVVVP